MYDFFWFSDSQRARIAPLLPTDVRGKKRVDDRRVPSGSFHALLSLRSGHLQGARYHRTHVLPPQKTGGASQRASSATLKTSWQLSRAPQPSSRGYNEPRP